MSVQVYDKAVDRGLEGVVACTTRVSSIVESTLCYRGYTIEDLAANSNFEEVIFLLWNNRLPKADELRQHARGLAAHLELPNDLVQLLRLMPCEAHPMAWLRTAVSMLALWNKKSQSLEPEDQKQMGQHIVGQVVSLVALLARLRKGQDYVPPHQDKSLAWNFLYMLQNREPEDEAVKVFDTCLVLHADHELNCSTFAARVTSSSLSDIYSALTTAIGTLKGPLHGGANEQVMRLLQKVGHKDKAEAWVEQALKNKEKIMGFGHRVYKQGDPRAKVLKGMSQSLTKKMGCAEWFEMSQIIDTTVQKRKGLLPNVDFYSATVYYALGIEIDLYTPIFALSRTGGWLAHIYEQHKNNRLYRPRGQYKGEGLRKWQGVDKR